MFGALFRTCGSRMVRFGLNQNKLQCVRSLQQGGEYFTDNSGAFMAQRREDTPGCETHSNHVSIKCQANFKQTLKKKKVNMLHFHKLIYINELGQVKCNLVRGWGSVGYIMCGCGSKQTRGKQTRRLNRERSAGIMTGQDVIVLS